jgi:hypothetical protein
VSGLDSALRESRPQDDEEAREKTAKARRRAGDIIRLEGIVGKCRNGSNGQLKMVVVTVSTRRPNYQIGH